MVSHVSTVAFSGIHTTDIHVQAHIFAGLPRFNIVGLGDKAIGESRERVRSVFNIIGLALPSKRVTINLSPADLAKEGGHFDLAIMLAILQHMHIIPSDALDNYIVMGEMALDGTLLPVSGILPAAMHAVAAGKGLICPHDNGSEALWASDQLDVVAASSVMALIHHFKGGRAIPAPKLPTIPANHHAASVDMRDVRGQHSAKRALEIAAAGNHNVLLKGTPGAGKSMLAACMPGILPPLTSQEMLEVSMIYSITGKLDEKAICSTRPFRDPHHNCSMPAMIGGGTKANPGEITLAHKGVLFLDELPEFSRQTLEALRQPLESKTVSIARAQMHVTYPADFQLIAAMNPCKCGYAGDEARQCSRLPLCVEQYQGKLSGPFLDRLDLFVDVPAVMPTALLQMPMGESSASIQKRVTAARELQYQRVERTANNALSGNDFERYIGQAINEEAHQTLYKAADSLKLSMRSFRRVQKLARTIADLAGSDAITHDHMTESLFYRDRSG